MNTELKHLISEFLLLSKRESNPTRRLELDSKAHELAWEARNFSSMQLRLAIEEATVVLKNALAASAYLTQS
jgi:hypothetical protein